MTVEPAPVSAPPPADSRCASWPRLLTLAWLLGLAGTIFVAWAAFRLVPFWTWSAARLAAAARVAYGLPLYTDPGDALVTGWVYGPVSALAYLPAIAAGEPLAALRVAAWLNTVWFLAPPLFVVAAVRASLPGHRDALLLATFGVATLLVPFGPWYGAAALGADTVAIALGVGSCVALHHGGRLALAALLCVLAAWTKQIAAPLALAQLAYLAGTYGRRSALRYAGWLALAAAAATALFGLWFGFGALWHCLIVIPGRHPIETARLPALLRAFAGSTWWVWPLAALVWWGRRAGRAGGGSGNGPSGNGGQPAPAGAGGLARLLLLASLVLLPGGLAAAAKAGGDQNSLHAISFALLGGTALGGAALAVLPAPRAALVRVALLAGLAAAVGAGVHRIVTHDHLAIREPGSQHRAAYAFARARPGQVVFPCNPLVTLMAERRDVPFDYGLHDWRLAGAAPEADALRRRLPPALTLVIYHEKDPSRELLRYLPEFRHRRESGPWDLYFRTVAPAADAAPPAP